MTFGFSLQSKKKRKEKRKKKKKKKKKKRKEKTEKVKHAAFLFIGPKMASEYASRGLMCFPKGEFVDC